MKKNMHLLLLVVTTLLLTGCTSAFYGSTSQVNDDLYALHSRTDIARREQAEAEARKAEAEARKAELEAMIAEAAAQSTENQYYSRSTGENYQSVLADDYESAYARRLRGMDSPTYRMPSSYMNARYSTTFHYVSAYDPAFYNVMVMGDEIWVEPKYVTAMFGTWGLPTRSSWYWNSWSSPWWSPSFSIGFGNWGWNVGLSWYDPWFYDWYSPWYRPWGSYYYGWSRPYWHHHYWHGHGPHWNGGGGYYPGHRPGSGRPGIVHRPSQNRYTKPYQGQGSTINRGQSGNRDWNSGIYQGDNRGQSGRPQGTVSRTPGSTQNNQSYNNSGSSTRRSRTSGSSSSYRSNSNWGSSSSSSSSRGSSWGSSSSSSSSRGSGGSFGGGGGSSRGGSSGSSSRGR